MSRWRDKVVLVTGASAGLGRAIAEEFAGRGANLVLAARGADALENTAKSLRAIGTDVLAVPTDVTSDTDVTALLAAAIERFKRLDVLVNCAGRSSRGLVSWFSVAQFKELMELNFFATVRVTTAALPHLLQSRGHVVNIGSLASKTASPYLGAYAASKFAVAAYSQQLRLEFGEEGLHALLVCPGPIKRDDAGERYRAESAGLPEAARRPGGGAKLNEIDPKLLARRIVRYCELRHPELIVPGAARLLFALAQLWPKLGDWIVRKKTK